MADPSEPPGRQVSPPAARTGRSRTPPRPDNLAEIPPQSLRWRCDPSEFPKTTAQIEPLEDIIGQERATRAIRLGLEIPGSGYNIYIAGFVGTGRNTTIRRFLEDAKPKSPPPGDLAYVNNFTDPDRPRLLRFPAGKGSSFRKALRRFVEASRKEIPQLLESEPVIEQRQQVTAKLDEQEREVSRSFEDQLSREKFALVRSEAGPMPGPVVVPLIEGQPADIDELEKLVAAGKLTVEERDRLQRRQDELFAQLRETMKKVRQIVNLKKERLRQLDTEVVKPVVREPLEEIAETHPQEGVRAYLDEVEKDVLARVDEFRLRAEGSAFEPQAEARPEDPFRVYEVNVIVDNAGRMGAPVIVENFPTFRNLFGTIERDVDWSGSASRTDFTRIKAGSLIRANGGYLLLNVSDVVLETGVWTMMKRVLRTCVAEIQNYESALLSSTTSVKPAPIEIRVKVVMMGDHETYRFLYDHDQDFRKIFKVRADFDVEMPNDKPGRNAYARFIRRVVSEESLTPFDRTAIAAVVEEGARASGQSDKLTTRFMDVADLVRESSYWSRRAGGDVVSGEHVQRAVTERLRRLSLVEDKIQEMLDRGLLLVDTEGSKVGQVNGLSAYEIGGHAFGRPTRITATLGMGRAGIVNIERESRLSGPTHDKGVLILTGLLRERFARNKPLTLSASLCFEQSYSGVDGDSASSAEIYALISALAEVPARQDLAVTGSVNQKGEIQPIGSVNEKIEGFYDTCASRKLSGKHGVVIPRRNLRDLMLRKDVVEAVESGKFHIYAIETIEEGLGLLMGMAAGGRKDGAGYPPGTLFARADARLRELADGIRAFGRADET